jgi:hypothetical protein
MNCWYSMKGCRGYACLWLNLPYPKPLPLLLPTWLPASQSLHPILYVDMCPHTVTSPPTNKTHTRRPNITIPNASQTFIIQTVILHAKQVTCMGHVLCNWKRPLVRHIIQVPSCRNCEDIECIKYPVIFTKSTWNYTNGEVPSKLNQTWNIWPLFLATSFRLQLFHFHTLSLVASVV